MPVSPPADPRIPHYLFAHRAVPRAFLQHPPAIMSVLASADAMKFLNGMWDILDGEAEPSEHSERTGLEVTCFDLRDDVFAAVVTMPVPARVFEAYFVAAVARLEGDDSFARCFTLDLARRPGPNAEVGVLEWDAEGQHTVMDIDCAATRSAFVDAVEELVTKTP